MITGGVLHRREGSAMVEIAVSNLKKEYELGKPVLQGLSFQIDSGERVGILGKNGAGKTTLLRILTGEAMPDSGQVTIPQGKRLGLISQIPVYPPDYKVEDVLETAFAELFALEEAMEALEGKLQDPGDLRRYDALQAAYEAGGGYERKTRLSKVANGLGISGDMRGRLFRDLSGGEKTRINLARLLLVDTDILLLDEPTNHLDLNATQWLEEYLDKYKGTVLAISHDRYFLDRVVKRCIELKEGRAEFYQGNYSFYALEKERRYLEQLRQYEKEQAKIQQLQTAADKLHLWAFMGNDKLHKRAFSMEKRMERLRKTDKPKTERKLSVRFGEKQFHGDELLILEKLTKTFGEQTLFSDLNLAVEDGDRIALLGDNGAGKTTLLKILTKECEPDGGGFKRGPTVNIGYLPQQIHFAHPERSLLNTMLYETGCTPQEARDRLAGFQFQGEDVFKAVSRLSGGEQSRLRLCMLMDKRINLLILDEPTNHLDLASREWIEEAVEDYEGALLFVSHDRYFIERFANRIWTLEDGVMSDYRGDYESYKAMRARGKIEPPAKPGSQSEKKSPPKEKRGGGTKQLKKDLAALERKLAKLEEEQAQNQRAQVEKGDDYLALGALMEAETALQEEYEALFVEWESLTEELEAQGAQEE